MENLSFPKVPLSKENLRTILFGDDIKKSFPEFELRRSQLEMIKTIIESFNHSKISLIEAGTGTGKSLAYLIPAIIFAVENNVKIVISTFTKNLQHQLIEKDIPLALEITNYKVKYSIIKGKGNYLCLKRFYETIELKQQYENLFDKTQKKQFDEELGVIEKWVSKTKTGDLEELSKDSIDSLFQEVNTDSDLCAHHRCPYFHDCFTYKAKQKHQESHLLIVNHSLLVSQLELDFLDIDNDIIPQFEYLIMDEAHNFIKSAMIEETSSFFGITRTINRIFTLNNQRGIINQLNIAMNIQNDKENSLKSSITELVEKDIKPYITQFKQNVEIFFSQLFHLVQNTLTHFQDKIVRINNIQKEDLAPLQELYQELKSSASLLLEILVLLYNKVNLLPEEFLLEHQTKIKMISQIEKKLDRDFFVWDMLFDKQEEKVALWIEIHEKTNNISIHYVNLNNGEFLNSTLYDSKKSIIMTSATLAVNGSIDFFKSQIHLEKDTINQILRAPFNYKEQCLFMIPKDISPPIGTDSLKSPFIVESLHLLKNIFKQISKKTLILCTSFAQMNIFENELKKDIDIPIFKQNSLPHQELISQFKKSSEGILIGVDTFWEGIDLPLHYLEMVIIVKLPFKPPTNPVTQTMYEILEKDGENPFFKISVPESIIRFKQGFGRLIRSRKDKGIILCLDNRIIEKSYGNLFLKSLPHGAYYHDSKTLVEKMKNFF